MYEGDNTTSSKPTMQQLKQHEQQQDNCSLTHMFWHHMLSLYSLRMRYFKLPAIFLVSVIAPLSGGRRVVRAWCGQRCHRAALVSKFLSIKVLYFILLFILWGGALRDDTKNGCVADWRYTCCNLWH